MNATMTTYDVALESAAEALYRRVLRAYERRFGDFAGTPNPRHSTLDAQGRIVLRSHERVLARDHLRGDRLFCIVPSGLGLFFRRQRSAARCRRESDDEYAGDGDALRTPLLAPRSSLIDGELGQLDDATSLDDQPFGVIDLADGSRVVVAVLRTRSGRLVLNVEGPLATARHTEAG